jgi:1-acyl-sn-glycerol-3-phosphate acyltransferase
VTEEHHDDRKVERARRRRLDGAGQGAEPPASPAVERARRRRLDGAGQGAEPPASPAVERAWWVGRRTIQPLVKLVAPFRNYGVERLPAEGGCVIAVNHFSWIDPPVAGAASPRIVRFVAKVEAHRVPGLGQLIRAFGTISVRRGESDREAVRQMLDAARAGHVVGLFVEGTRQKTGVPGTVQPGAAMVAIQAGVPVIPLAIHGTQAWRLGNWKPISVAWGKPMTFEGLPRGGRGYRDASQQIEAEIRRLWEWLVDVHARGRPKGLTPP